MSFNKKGNPLKKFLLSSLTIVFLASSLFLSTPKKADAAWPVIDFASLANTIKTVLKDYVADGLANKVAKMALQKLTAQTVNWINSGFQGGPAFITNPSQFFGQLGDNIASDFLSNTSFNRLCSPFQAQVRITLSRNYLQEDPFGYTCTLGQIANNYDSFINNFNNGGWDYWFQITQNSQNNPYGSYIGARNELAVRIGTTRDNYQRQLDWGSGFSSYERCKPGTETIPTETVTIPQDGGNPTTQTTYDCSPDNKETVTPGKVIDDQLSNALGSSWRQLEAADEINEIVSALVMQLTQQIIGGAVGGLRSLTEGGSSNNNRAFIEQLAASSPESLAELEQFRQNIEQDANQIHDDVRQVTDPYNAEQDPNNPFPPSQETQNP